MRKATLKLLAVGLLAASLVLPGVSPALAKSPATPKPTPTPTATPTPVVSSPEHPLAYADQALELKPGEWHWYSFKYSFDDSGDADQGPAHIRLDTDPAEGATLLLLNGDQVRAWEQGEKLQNFGEATTVMDQVRIKVELDTFCNDFPDDPACTGDPVREESKCENLRDPAGHGSTCNFSASQSRGYATWSGVIGASGVYYILVRAEPQVSGSIQYTFSIDGDGLSMK
jgi:hypothetical protein